MSNSKLNINDWAEEDRPANVWSDWEPNGCPMRNCWPF